MEKEKATKKTSLFYWRSLRTVQEIQEELAACEQLIVYDLETTGFNPLSSRIIELAAIKLSQRNVVFHEEARLHRYFRLPKDIPLPDETVKLTGITREQLEEAERTEEECLEDVLHFFRDTPIAGYNSINFDDLVLWTAHCSK